MIIYHNPRCSKSRAALKLLTDEGVNPTVVLYLESPPTAEELGDILKKLGAGAKQLIRFKDEGAKKLGISPKDERSESEWINLMAQNPAIIERPIVVAGGKAVVGRPPENVLHLL
jgi:arsenate reductase (glutaredoxin)